MFSVRVSICENGRHASQAHGRAPHEFSSRILSRGLSECTVCTIIMYLLFPHCVAIVLQCIENGIRVIWANQIQ